MELSLSQIWFRIPTNSNESANINIELLTNELENEEYEVTIHKGGGGLSKGISYRKSRYIGWISNETNNSYISYDLYSRRNLSDIDIDFEFVYTHISWVVNICNLTIDWSHATWTVWVHESAQPYYFSGYPPE
jgi:hypothetical protein